MDPTGRRSSARSRGVVPREEDYPSSGRQVQATTPQRRVKYVVVDGPKRGWFAATWRWYWHWPNIAITKAVLTLLSLAFSADTAAEGAEVASDVTGIGILDNVLLIVEVPAGIVMLIIIAVELFRHREKIRYYRYHD